MEDAEFIQLKVAWAKTKDVGRGLVRVDSDSMEIQSISTDDVIEIIGKKRTVARCLPLDSSEQRKRIIKMDFLIQANSGVTKGDMVTIRKMKAVDAEKVVVVPLEAIPSIDERYLADALENIPVIKGDNVIVPYFGGRLSFEVVDLMPAGPVLVTKKTVFHIAEKGDDDIKQELWDKANEKFDNNEYEKCIEITDDSIRRFPKEKYFWYLKGKALECVDRFEEAIKCFDQVLELDGDDFDTWLSKGYCLLSLDRFDESKKCLLKSIELDDSKRDPWINLSIIQVRCGQYQEALDSFDIVSNCKEENNLNDEFNPVDYQKMRGYCFEMLGKYGEAKACYATYLVHNPEDMETLKWKKKLELKLEVEGKNSPTSPQKYSELKEYDDNLTSQIQQKNRIAAEDWMYQCLAEAKDIIKKHHVDYDTTVFFEKTTYELFIQHDNEHAYAYTEISPDSNHFPIGIHPILSENNPQNHKMLVIILVHELLHAIHDREGWGHDTINPLERKLANLAGYFDALIEMENLAISGRMSFCNE